MPVVSALGPPAQPVLTFFRTLEDLSPVLFFFLNMHIYLCIWALQVGQW